jgi:hypothetical protein
MITIYGMQHFSDDKKKLALSVTRFGQQRGDALYCMACPLSFAAPDYDIPTESTPDTQEESQTKPETIACPHAFRVQAKQIVGCTTMY